MDQKLENRRTMYHNVLEWKTTYNSILTLFPAILALFNVLTGLVTEINSKIKFIKETGKGTTTTKQAAAADLIVILMRIIGPLHSVGRQKKDHNIQTQTKYSKSALEKLSDQGLADFAKIILSLANLNITDLAGFGITQADLTELEDLLITYSASLGKKGFSKDQVKNANKELKKLFSNISTFLDKDLDPAMEAIKRDHLTAYNEYHAARNIKDLGIRHEEKVEEPVEPAN